MAELSVSRKSVKELLSLSDTNTKGKIYIIPEYQRPYRWDKEKCETLWIDLTNFYEDTRGEDDHEYFLGTIVTCSDESSPKNIDVIDGQQRITSLFLLLRAFYTKFEEMLEKNPNDDEIIGLMKSIEPCIWNVNKITHKVVDKKDIHIHSLVATDKDNQIYHYILETGKALNDQTSNYKENYEFFLKKYNEYITSSPKDWKELCLSIIERCIVLPIECDTLDSALTIFGTLNDRGLPLSDSDIFKAELYKQKTSKEEKDDFTKSWKELEETVNDGGFSLDALFRYYTHIIRGMNCDNTKEIGLRRFYAGGDNKYKLFKNSDFFKNIQDLAAFWKEVNVRNEEFDDTNRFCNVEAKKYIHCLNCYPNEYWKYPISVYYHVHKNDGDFKPMFADFLRRLLSYMFVRFVESPTVNKIKDPTFNFCIDVASRGNADFSYKIPENFKQQLSQYSSSKISKPMILLEAYLFDDQQKLIQESFEIEHIFPQKWQNTNYNGWNQEEAKKHLNMFGNKIAFEKKLNIQAGNGYFGQKKSKYCLSRIKEVVDLSTHESEDWTRQDIESRDEKMLNRLESFFKKNIDESHKSSIELYNMTDGNETVLIVKTDDNGNVKLILDAVFEDSTNATLQEVLSKNIPTKTIHEVCSSMDVLISYIPKEFIKKHADDINGLLLTAL